MAGPLERIEIFRTIFLQLLSETDKYAVGGVESQLFDRCNPTFVRVMCTTEGARIL